MNLSTKSKTIIGIITLTILVGSFFSCKDRDVERCQKAISAGNLTEAQEYLIEISNRSESERCALPLIRMYLDVNEVEKAIYIYENITYWHSDRYHMKWDRGKYERTVCKLLRECLLKNGDYKRAWNYYPLEYNDENYVGNAQSRYTYMSDVVAALSQEGRQEEARRWIEDELRWFVNFVDCETSSLEHFINIKNSYNSIAVRERLLQQIDNSY